MPTQYPELFSQLAKRFKKVEERTLPKGGGIIYVTARTVMNRLDEIIGVENWWDEYSILTPNSVICHLTIKLPDGSTVTKCDAGGAANMKDAGDDDKSMVSDAFKRAAGRFGIGRYLYKDGVPDFVVNELTKTKDAKASKRAQAAATEPAPTTAPEPATPTPAPTSPDLPATRAEVNGAFPPGKKGGSAEKVRLKHDQLGPGGMDPRKWQEVLDLETAAANVTTNALRLDLKLEPGQATNVFEVMNHVARVAVENGATDYNPPGPDGKRKPCGQGKTAKFLAELYKADPEWRDWIRGELRTYLSEKVAQARTVAKAEAYDDYDDEPAPTAALAAVGAADGAAGSDGEEWQEGRQ